MSAPNRGLGRGLGALLGQERETVPGLLEIPVASIRPNPQQPRKTFDVGALDELRQSIAELGVLVPIIVRALPAREGTYELIAGERRWRAATAARLATIPAIVRDADNRASLEFAIVENLQRRDLDPLEEAMGYQHLIDEYHFTQDRLAERLGKSRPAIANALRLLALSDPIQARLRGGQLSAGHARALLAVPLELREGLAARVERDQLTVRDIERIAAGRREPAPRGTAAPKPKSADVREVENRLRYLLGAPVAIVPGTAGGRLEIRYGSTDELIRIVDVLLREPA